MKVEAPSALNNYFQHSSLPSAIMGSIDKDGITEWKSFGPSIWKGADTVSENHIFCIYSMTTKAFSSKAALQLVEKHIIGLDDPLNELMPEMASIPILTSEGALVKCYKAITLRQLLTHTAGFDYDFLSQRLLDFNPENWEYQNNPRLFEPGEKWQYGTNMDLVGWVIENLSGQDLEAYFRNNITGPQQMNRTWFNVPDSLKDKIVSYGIRDSLGFQEYTRIPNQPTKVYFAGHGLFSSPRDYITFLKCILNDGKYSGGEIIKPETVAMLFENQLPDNSSLEFDIGAHTLDR